MSEDHNSLPPTRGEGQGPDENLRMAAYYYSFTRTGQPLIDRILSAVACAGKAYHHTDSWIDETPPYEPCFRGASPADWIQNAADDAAAAAAAGNAREVRLVKALTWYADQFCELGAGHEACGHCDTEDCAGCPAVRALRDTPEGVAIKPAADGEVRDAHSAPNDRTQPHPPGGHSHEG